MEKRMHDVLEKIDFDDLIRIKKDLDTGGALVKKIVDEKLKELEARESRICVSCGQAISPYTHETFTLNFGPPDFRKKASFCAIDCLEYFLEHLKITKKRSN
ncbi:MAG TPA: hypothetical protein VI894_02680 [Candidatus Nanoarchaeia archaeon]|nr:hypothetical protein [Candidatus Nanoarchaeia archaeon]